MILLVGLHDLPVVTFPTTDTSIAVASIGSFG